MSFYGFKRGHMQSLMHLLLLLFEEKADLICAYQP
jgi:hypothetical protein